MKYLVTFLAGIIPFTLGVAAIAAVTYACTMVLVEYPLIVLAPIVIVAIYEVGEVTQEKARGED